MNLGREIFTLLLLTSPTVVIAQAAGAGADFNRQDSRATEIQRLKNYDKPVKKDPVGNALIGGVVSGVVKTSVGSGVQSVATGTVATIAKEKVKEK